MSGRDASSVGAETGLPLLANSKWSPPTRRETKIPWLPLGSASDHATHGAVMPPGVKVPAAIRGSSASRSAATFSEHASSDAWSTAHAPKPCVPLVSKVFTLPAVPRPTATYLKPPSAVGSATALAAKTCSVLRRPICESFCSYQTTHGTVSLGPVNAKSGSMPSRVGSMFRVGSVAPVEVAAPLVVRSMPVCCQQNAPTLVPPPGLLVEQSVCLIAPEAKIWLGEWSLSAPPSRSCHATHGTGALPATAAPPTTAGFSASRSTWMFSDGILLLGARSWPSGIHFLLGASNRDAKMLVALPPSSGLGSYQETHGTVRSAPAKSIDGASASWWGSMFSEAGEPCVTHCPPLKARTKICCSAPGSFCSKVAQGTRTPPGASEPPTTSEAPASPDSLTWPPGGRPRREAGALAAARPRVAAAAADSTAPRRMMRERMGELLLKEDGLEGEAPGARSRHAQHGQAEQGEQRTEVRQQRRAGTGHGTGV